MNLDLDYKSHFIHYQRTVHQIEVDVTFWKYFLTISIDRYKLENPINRWIRQSGFSLYDIPLNGTGGWLKMSEMTSTIEIDDLHEHNTKFFVWIMNLALVRAYNSLELLLLQAIQSKFFPSMDNPSKGKRQASKVIGEIKTYLKTNNINYDTTNNRHIISFLKEKSDGCKQFLALQVNRQDWIGDWETFYELFSVLRNIIVHDAMVLSKNNNNLLRSLSIDIFTHFFKNPEAGGLNILEVKDDQYFSNFLILVNDIGGNTLKYLAEKQNLTFIGLT